MTDVSELYYDPYDYEIDADPYPIWRRMRDDAPLYRNERHDFWALSRFQDVLDASIDHSVYSSARGTVLEVIRGPQPLPMQPMIFMDPPEHDRLRGLVSRAFSPKRIAEMEASTRTIVRDYRTHGDVVWTRFRAGEDGVRWYYRAMYEALSERRDDLGPAALPVLDELGWHVDELDRLATAERSPS